MNKDRHYILTFALLLTTYLSSNAMDAEYNFEKDPNYIHIKVEECGAIQAAHTLNIIALQFNIKAQKFNILHKGLTPVRPENIDKPLKNIACRDQLNQFLDNGNYIKITHLSDGNFTLQACARGLGGCSSDWFYGFYEGGYHTTKEEALPAARTTPIIPAPRIHPNPLDTNLASTNSPQIGHIPTPSTITTLSNTPTEQGNDK